MKRKRNAGKKVLVCIILILVAVAFMQGIFWRNKTADDVAPDFIIEQEETENDKIEELIKEMSLSDKVYQMMFVTPESITGIGVAVRAGETTKQALSSYPVGGIVYFAHNFENREQTKEMIANTQSYSEIPLFISVDEEGGRVSRLGSNPSMGVTKHPAMKLIGESKDYLKAYEVGKTLGTELYELGFNVDFAPDADVIINVENSEIGDRSFGTEPEIVAEMTANVVKGMEECNVSSTLKHFPGHGSTFVDSHTGYSASSRSIDELRENEFLPFKKGIEAGADFIMVSHMTLVNATKEKLPSSLSEEVVTGMLKGELGFSGIIITDSFSMGAVTEHYTSKEAAVMAVKAGVDMILMPKNLEEAKEAIVKAVEAGEISEERINESVRKILLKKQEKNLI